MRTTVPDKKTWKVWIFVLIVLIWVSFKIAAPFSSPAGNIKVSSFEEIEREKARVFATSEAAKTDSQNIASPIITTPIGSVTPQETPHATVSSAHPILARRNVEPPAPTLLPTKPPAPPREDVAALVAQPEVQPSSPPSAIANFELSSRYLYLRTNHRIIRIALNRLAPEASIARFTQRALSMCIVSPLEVHALPAHCKTALVASQETQEYWLKSEGTTSDASDQSYGLVDLSSTARDTASDTPNGHEALSFELAPLENTRGQIIGKVVESYPIDHLGRQTRQRSASQIVRRIYLSQAAQ